MSAPSHAHAQSMALSPPEQRFLLTCARTRLAERHLDLVRSVAGHGLGANSHPGLNWDRVLTHACQHNLAPLLNRGLALSKIEPEAGPSAAVREQLQKVVLFNAANGRRLAGELARLMTAFDQAGVRALPFKGPVLAASAYGSISLRPFNDLDVIVRPGDAGRAARLLSGLGFPDWGVPSTGLGSHLRCECEHSFARADGVTVDLHWRLSRRHFPFPLAFDHLWRRSVPCVLWPGGPTVPNLGAADALQTLCMHGTKHAWERLSWVCDIAELLAANPELPWDFVFAQSEMLGATRMLRLGVALAADLLDAPIPPVARQRLKADPGIAALARHVRAHLFHEPLPTAGLVATVRQSLFHLRVRNRASQRIRYCLLAAAPTPRDLSSATLPPSLYFLYYLTRPVRLFTKLTLNFL